MKTGVLNFSSFFYALGFFAKTLKGIGHFILQGQVAYRVLVMQILFTFVEALGIASLLALGIGASVNTIGMLTLRAWVPQDRLIYVLLIILITRELGPLLAAFIIIARSATAIAIEIGNMVISHEIEAYISVGVDPIEHIAVPRFMGVTISLFLLNIYFSIFGLAGSFLVIQIFNPMPAEVYFNNLLDVLTAHDILISVIKSISFGMIIAIIALMQGFSVERASTEIPVAGLKSVGSCFAWVIIVDILLSAIYYMVLA
jgi:phospholipid/cholesterol/gamma-HCH transport system permease protein